MKFKNLSVKQLFSWIMVGQAVSIIVITLTIFIFTKHLYCWLEYCCCYVHLYGLWFAHKYLQKDWYPLPLICAEQSTA